MERILVTGSCGFIGMHLSLTLLRDGYKVMGVDNINDYYDINIKYARLKELEKFKNFSFNKVDISDCSRLKSVFEKFKPNKVVNLAAQAGVRYSIINPNAYIHSNIVGFMNVLEACRIFKVKGLIYASSSSVYGENKKTPFSISDPVNKPISIYSVTKRSNELMAYSYHHLYGIKSTALRYFTVYGPWGRPDMAIYIFTKNIINHEYINVYNNGSMMRDFTYIDDIISGTISAIEKNYKYEIFNLGNNKSENILDMIKVLEKNIGIEAKINFKKSPLGDVKKTFASIEESNKKLGYKPITSISEGIPKFINWYKSFYKA
tara:strand:- start:46 stop:1002 length:957 start_codon:yes stop_codon:yes gene_type:complete